MNKTIIALLAVLLLSAGAVSASLTDGLQVYYSFDNSTVSGVNITDIQYPPQYNATKSGVAAPANVGYGKLADGVEFDADNEDAPSDYNNLLLGTVGTYNFWYKQAGTAAAHRPILSTGGSYFLFRLNLGGATCTLYANGGVISVGFPCTQTTTAFTMWTVRFNGTHADVFRNGTKIDTTLFANNIGNGDFSMSMNPDTARGVLDELGIWNRSLTQTEIDTLYNDGAGLAYSAFVNFQITAAEFDTSAAITTFNATLSNATISWPFNTTTGTITTNVSSGVYNITISAPSYFDNITLNHDASAALASLLYQSNISFSSVHEVTGDAIAGVTYTSANGQSSTSRLYLAAGNTNVTAYKVNYFSNADTITVAALEDSSRQINLSTHIINVTAYNYTGGQIMEFDLIAEYLNGSYTKTYSTTTGNVIVLALNGTWNLTINNTDYALTSNLSYASTNYTKANFTMVYTTNSINFSFYDEETGALITNQVDVDLISTDFADNYTTSTGSLYVDLIVPATYTIRYGSAGYDERHYYFTLVNRTYNTIPLYLLNSSSSSNVTATVYDQNNNLIEGIQIQMLKYDITTNSYKMVEMIETNFEGAGVLHLTLGDELYKFMLFSSGTLLKTTNPTYIYTESINFQVVLGGTALEDFYTYNGITFSLDYDDTLDQFDYTYTDPSGTTAQGCLTVWRQSINGLTFVNQSCANAASGSLSIAITPANETHYKAIGYADGNLVASRYQSFLSINTAGKLGLFIVVLLCIIFAFSAIWNAAVAVVLTPVPLLVGSFLGITGLSLYYTLPLQLLALIVAYIIHRST